ncbi:hypothetical protein [Halomarina ordinaria]|uniref:Uncharacterized protein n=1 Tax=Halomarina ordinaria TaxID=3033939 RepID=A0ABD5U5H9_9EURY|nr:hypothetical protein [Halomarina sp. PSRA2]
MSGMTFPTRKLSPVIAAFWIYVGICGAIALGTTELGVSSGGAFLVFLVAGAVLLKPFLSLSRRVLPRLPHEPDGRVEEAE